MDFKKGEKFTIVHNLASQHDFPVGETVLFTGEYAVEFDMYKMDNGTYWQWLDKTEIMEVTISKSKRMKPKEPDTPLEALFKEGEELLVTKRQSLYSSVKQGDTVTFVRMQNKNEIVAKDSKNKSVYIMKADVEKVIPTYDRENEMNLDFRLHSDTQDLMQEIMEFHKNNFIDKCLETGDLESIKKVM